MVSNYGYDVLIFGGPKEREKCDYLKASIPGVVDCTELDVIKALRLMPKLKLFVGNDTGTTHMAAASKVPTVVLQSYNNPPGKWDPLVQSEVIRPECPASDIPREIDTIPPWKVIAGVKKLLE
jgi:ADP-heptose:LPS heptosyltransferase